MPLFWQFRPQVGREAEPTPRAILYGRIIPRALCVREVAPYRPRSAGERVPLPPATSGKIEDHLPKPVDQSRANHLVVAHELGGVYALVGACVERRAIRPRPRRPAVSVRGANDLLSHVDGLLYLLMQGQTYPFKDSGLRIISLRSVPVRRD